MKNFLRLCFLTLSTIVCSTLAHAASSDWAKTAGAKVRLISLPAPDGKTIQAGLQIVLDKGWKTYWRSPGASGLPPQINFGGSKNVITTSLDFPVPDTFGNQKNLTAGYKNSITFPIFVEPLFANRPVTLAASGLIGICGEICVPFQFSLELNENGTGFSSAEIARTLFKSTSNLMGKPSSEFKVNSLTVDGDTLYVKAAIPKESDKSALFVEGPSDWYLTPARAKSIQAGVAEFEVSLRDIPTGTNLSGTKLMVSLVADGIGVSQELILGD